MSSKTKFVLSALYSGFFLGSNIGLLSIPDDAGMAAIVIPWIYAFLGLLIGLIIAFGFRNRIEDKLRSKIMKILLGVGTICLVILIYLFTTH